MHASENAEPEVFLRKSSGLVKSAGPFDVFLFNFGLCSVGIAVTLAYGSVPGNYPGANIPLSVLLAGLCMAAIAWGFWCWSVVIPRSGGVYAFISRSLSPGLGFSISFVDTFTWLFYNALAASFLTTIGIGPGLYAVGHLTGSPGLKDLAIAFQQPGAQLAVGTAAIATSSGILILGLKAFFRVQVVIFAAAVVGTLAAVAILGAADHRVFVDKFDAALAAESGDVPSQQVLAAAPPPEALEFSFSATCLAIVWPMLSFVGSIFSVNIGGEVRNSRRSQLIGMFGAIAAAATVMAVLAMLADRVFSPRFQAGLVLGSGRDEVRLPLTPSFSLLTAITAEGAIAASLVCIGFFAWAFFWLPATMMYATRAVIAWSFDRLAPASLGYVHPTRHTPVNAILAVAAVNWLFLVLYLYTPFFGSLVLVLAAMFAWLPTMVGAAAFPFLRPDMYRRSALGNVRLLGMPIMTVAGTVGLLGVVALTVMLWNDPLAAGHSPASLGTIATVFAVGAAWYWIARRVRRRRGIAIDKAFTELPIE
ncbi:MAG TPA: APC family permease [Gemmataceae bacterium]|jgi:amino acid transporter|nr:APC family permease [Gemmataceae bacterium]